MKKTYAVLSLAGLLALASSPLSASANIYSETSVHQDISHPINHSVLKKAKPEEVGMSSAKLREVDAMIEQEIKSGFPGAVLLVVKNGKVVKNTAYGYAKKYNASTLLKHPEKMKEDTMFDLASNTKMYAVNFALQKLVSEEKLNLNEKVQTYLSDFKDQPEDVIKGKNQMKVIDLLHHSGGFPPDPQYFHPKAGSLYSQDRAKTINLISKTPLQYEPGTKNVYSDVDYMLLGIIVERITNQRLDYYVENEIYRPLGLKHTLFNPLQKGFKSKNFAATELQGNTRDGIISFPNVRTYTLQGEVHDEKAYYSMAGISGHAGLFSTTSDLAVLLQVMLNGGGYGRHQLFDEQTIQSFTKPSPMNSTYALGWRRNGDESMEWMFGPHASRDAIGHTGWVGTVTIIDREKDLGIVLLTNKKHSPLVNPSENPNRFEGDVFETGQYGSVVTGVYEAIK
ncbi:MULTISPECIES: penicillin binding protein PBP4B [Bacillaceae]|uniref:penicillin binding protein PBP4B n=1 Tax=Bacillaceae TaxID=186817 RepID=UPI00104CFDCE|nr:penicillin binding protein PBP4B [Bacillus sp. CBEL-1]TDB50123.1 penicillin binding protein PBP4B [Bacillus sp. CBEL-1]